MFPDLLDPLNVGAGMLGLKAEGFNLIQLSGDLPLMILQQALLTSEDGDLEINLLLIQISQQFRQRGDQGA